MQLSAIREKDVHADSHGLLILARVEFQSNFVAFLHRDMCPAQAHQVSRIVELDAPIYDRAFVILGIKINLAMGVGPNESCDNALYGNPFTEIVTLRSMVRHNGATEREESHSQRHEHHESTFHRRPPSLRCVTHAIAEISS